MKDRIGGDYHTDDAATYSGIDLGKTVAVGAGLALITILAMVAFVGTPVAGFALWAYTEAWGAPFVGLVIFGVGLTAARYFGIKGVAEDNLLVAGLASLLAVVTYGAFGAMILSLYLPALWFKAITITGGITVAITLLAGLYVHRTDKDLSHFAGISGALMLVGLLAYLLYTIVNIQAIALVGFVAILIGFLFDLVYEIWATSDGQRSPVANGIAIYIAFIGVFVHILQWVLMALGDS